MSRKTNEHSLSDALKSFIRENKLQTGLDKVEIREAWQQLMGPGVNAYTESVELKGEVLYVRLSSSVLREELSLGQSKIINMLNEAIGHPLVNSLVLQ